MRRFYIRRGLRLLPALYATMVAFGLYFLVSGDATLRAYVGACLKMLTYSANFFIGDDLFLTYWFGQTWSLAIEEQFYIVWPFALVGAMALVQHRPRALAGLLAAVIALIAVWRVVLLELEGGLWSEVYYRTDARFDQPLAGALLAVLLHFGLVRDRPRPWMGVAGLAIWMGATALASPFEASYFRVVAPLVTLAACMTILGVLHGLGPASAALAWRPLRWMGRISYTLYLVHVGVFEAFRVHFEGEGRNVSRVALANAVALLVTVAMHRVVEAPALRLKDRWAPKD